MDMQQELETLFHREVDLVDKRGLKNPYRRSEIMNTRQIIYASEQPWCCLRRDMIQAIRRIQEFTTGLTFDDY